MKRFAALRPSRQGLAWLTVMVATAGLLSWRLGNLLPGLAAPEQPLPRFHRSLQAIWNQPLNLPITLSRLVVAALLPTGDSAASRLPAALLGLLLAASGYWLIRKWYGYRLAFLGSLLLISAPWFLHVSRLATGTVCFPLATMVVMALAARWHDKQRPAGLLPVSAGLLAIATYVPGIIWLILSFKIIERKAVIASYRAHPKAALASIITTVIILVPLGHSMFKNWHSYRQYLGWPARFPDAGQFGRQFIAVWEHIFVRGYNNPVYNLGGLAVVSVLISIAFVTGLYVYSQHFRASRSRLLAALWLIGTSLVALGGPVSLSLLLPIVLMLAIGGIGYWLHVWLKTFPRNPLARNFGIAMVALVIGFALTYNLRNYFVAWPLDPATKAAFSRPL